MRKARVKSRYEASREPCSHPAGWNLEFRDEPLSAGCEMLAEARDEVIGFGFGEAIEEEVGADEVVGAGGLESSGVFAIGGKAIANSEFCGAVFEKAQHNGARVDSFGEEMWVGGEKFGNEAAVAISDDECAAAISDLGEIVEAAALEHRAEGEVLHRTIEACDAVEAANGIEARRTFKADGVLDHPRHGRTKKTGVRRAASTAMRMARRKPADSSWLGVRSVNRRYKRSRASMTKAEARAEAATRAGPEPCRARMTAAEATATHKANEGIVNWCDGPTGRSQISMARQLRQQSPAKSMIEGRSIAWFDSG